MDGTHILSAMVNKTSNKPYSETLVSEVLDMRDLRAVSGPVWREVWRVDSRVNSEVILSQFWTLSEKPHRNHEIAFIWP